MQEQEAYQVDLGSEPQLAEAMAKSFGVKPEPDGDGVVVLDKPEQISMAQLLVFKYRFGLELRGFRSRVNTLQAYNGVFDTSFKTRKRALRDCNARIVDAEIILEGLREEESDRAQFEEYKAKVLSMTVPQLKEVMKRFGAVGYSKMNKTDLQEAVLMNLRMQGDDA
jgi:hypothetical protein